MDIFDQILENLELERDLGTRMVEIDRALLVPPKPVVSEPVTPEPAAKVAVGEVSAGPSAAAPTAAAGECDILFVTGRPLSAAGLDAMKKTVAAMRKIRADLDVCINEDRRAKVVVLLGSDALRKRMPSMRPVRGKWIELDGRPAVTTFSPDYIFSRFQDGSQSMVMAKKEMWDDIKSAISRLP